MTIRFTDSCYCKLGLLLLYFFPDFIMQAYDSVLKPSWLRAASYTKWSTAETDMCIFWTYLGMRLKRAFNKFLGYPNLSLGYHFLSASENHTYKGMFIWTQEFFKLMYILKNVICPFSPLLIVICKLKFVVAEISHLETSIKFWSCFIHGWGLWTPRCSSRLTINLKELICLLWIQPTCLDEKAGLSPGIVGFGLSATASRLW